MEKNRDFQTERLAYAKSQWYAVPGEYLRAFVLAEACSVHGEWRGLSWKGRPWAKGPGSFY